MESRFGGLLLSTSDAAKILHRSEWTLRRWARMGDGPISPIRLVGNKGRLLWRRNDIETAIGMKIPENMDNEVSS